MKKHYYISIVVLAVSVSLMAQDLTQAFRFSQNYPIGTARYQAMGGALGAMGGDFTSASTNPAGLGLYRKNEFTITPTLHINNTSTNYLANSTSDHVSNLNISNLGFVSSYNTGRDKGIVNTTFAFGYNALNNFHNSMSMQGVQNDGPTGSGSSLLDNFVMNANMYGLDPYYEELAYEAAALPWDPDLDDGNGDYWHNFQPYPAIGYAGYGQDQMRIVERSGYLGEYAFSGALNIDHKIYLGATLGIHSVRYYEDISHFETDSRDLEPEINSFEFGEYNSTRGYGYALKLGMILKPIHMLRIGASFHLPVVYRLTDEKFTEFYSYFDANSGIPNAYASYGIYPKEYTLTTPMRAGLSAALLIGRFGILTAEYEYVDYSFADLDSPGYNFAQENMTITEDMSVAHNLKAGAELRFGSLYFRGGIQYYMNPYSDKSNGSDMMIYSGGLGIRSGQTFIDFAFSSRIGEDLYGLYETESGFEVAESKYTTNTAMVTLGYRFR